MAKQPPVKLIDAVPVVVPPVSLSCPPTLRYVVVAPVPLALVKPSVVTVPLVLKRSVEVAAVVVLLVKRLFVPLRVVRVARVL